jgi:hypothetical protein
MASSRVTTENTDLHRTSKRNATSRAVLARRQRVELGTVEQLAGRVAANDLENQSQDAMSPDCVVEITTPPDHVPALNDFTVMDRIIFRGSLARLVRRCLRQGVSIRDALMAGLSRAAMRAA